jgi:C4-dicarboxylate-specific signal transduction histidine kinase
MCGMTRAVDEIALLLIEDELDHRVLVQRHLDRCNGARFQVVAAECLRDGLARLNDGPVQAILLDLRLPDSFGRETLEQVRRAAPQSAIVILSSLADEKLALAAVQQGAQDYLVKSDLNSELLSRAIRYAIERKRHESMLEQEVAARTAELSAANERLAREIDEHKRARKQLAEQQQRLLQSERLAAIGEMVAGLAHESRNALQRSRACLSMLAHAVEDRPRAVELVQRLQQAQDDLTCLYDRVRQYAAPVRLEKGPVDLEQLMGQVWNHLGPLRAGRTATLVMPEPRTWPTCHADRMALEQVVRNVLENALAACQDPVRIVITCDELPIRGQPAIRLVIRDNGPGFGDEQLSRLFEPFYTTKTKGTGLGLAISKRLVEGHGGVIEAANHPDGAEICITLPREGTGE